MITAIIEKLSEPRDSSENGVVQKLEMDFNTIGEIEDYLAYYRAYITSIQFKGKIVV